MGSQSEILFYEILDVQKILSDDFDKKKPLSKKFKPPIKILAGWTTFFLLALQFGRNS